MNTFREQPNCFPITLSRSCGVGALFCSLLHPPGLFLLLLLPVVVVVVVIIFLLRSSILPERARGRTANLTSEAHRLLQRGHQSARRRICDEGKNVVGSIHQISRRPNEGTKERTENCGGKTNNGTTNERRSSVECCCVAGSCNVGPTWRLRRRDDLSERDVVPLSLFGNHASLVAAAFIRAPFSCNLRSR